MIFSHHHAHARRDVDMTQGSITRHLIQFALPLLAGNVFQQLYNMVDTWVVGNFVSNEAFSAVGTVGPIINMLIGFFMGLSSGAGVVISQYYGAHRPEKVRDTVHTAMVLTLVLCAAFTALGLALIPAMLDLMNTPAEVLPESTAYLSIYFSGITGLLIYNMGSGILRAVGDSRRPFYFLVVSAVLNTGLDLLFVMGFGMGVAGAALATVLSEGGAGIFCFVWLLKKYPILRPEEDEKRLRLSYMGKVVFMSVPMGLQYSVTAIGTVILQTSINELGEVAVAAYSIGSKVKSLFFCPLNAMGSALATFTGQNYGYGDMKRVRRGIRSTIVMGVLYCILVIAVAMTASTVLAGLFVDASESRAGEVIACTAQFIRYIGVFMLLLAVLFPVRYAVQGMGHGDKSLFSGMAEMAARIAMSLWVVPVYGFTAVCISEGVTFLAGILVIVPIAWRISR